MFENLAYVGYGIIVIIILIIAGYAFHKKCQKKKKSKFLQKQERTDYREEKPQFDIKKEVQFLETEQNKLLSRAS